MRQRYEHTATRHSVTGESTLEGVWRMQRDGWEMAGSLYLPLAQVEWLYWKRPLSLLKRLVGF